jgi:hypothetical protein
MKSNINKLSIIFIFVFVLTAASFAAETIAVVLKVKGKVSITRGNQVANATIKRGFRLEDGDIVKTDNNSYTAVRFIDDASLLRVRANSTCTIKGTKERNQVIKNVYLEVGTILAKVTQQRGKFEISTPTSVASVKGTEWITEQRFNGGTFYYGLEGVVELTSDGGTALLHEDETGYVASSSSAPIVQPTKEGTVPSFDEGIENGTDFFEFEFENQDGQKKLLEFKATKKEE